MVVNIPNMINIPIMMAENELVWRKIPMEGQQKQPAQVNIPWRINYVR